MLLVPFLAVTCIATMLAVPVSAASSCQTCHADAGRMQALGYSHLTVTPNDVALQSGMAADCVACHRGNPAAQESAEAHRGISRFVVVRKKGLEAQTTSRRQPFLFTGNSMERIKVQTDKGGQPVVDTSVAYLLYGDRRPDTLSVDFTMLQQTCGTCHSSQFAAFAASSKAQNGKQSAYRSWTDKERGPHNCGAWFATGKAAMAKNTNQPFSDQAADVNQRTCNSCHVGCLDCHYFPQPTDPAQPKAGMHTFYRKPSPASCYGGGRGSTCHAGPEERRRGAGYFGGAYSYPEGAVPDIHAVKGVGCLDCHESSATNKGLGHATIKRQGICIKCHQLTQMSHGRSLHKNLSCEACHIQDVGGYQGTFWGPGKHAGVDTPFFKYKDYYGTMKEPFLIRNQQGRWIPVKPFPMAVLNQKAAKFKPGLHWRWPKDLPDLGRTDDAWGYVGLVSGLPENNQALLWVQMDKLSHKLGPSRPCASCHELPGNEQRQTVEWEFSDQGALPFSGSHTVVGGKKGLSIRNIKASEPIEPIDGRSVSSFAPWSFWPEKWVVKGDFTLPPIKNQKLYNAVKGDVKQSRKGRVIH